MERQLPRILHTSFTLSIVIRLFKHARVLILSKRINRRDNYQIMFAPINTGSKVLNVTFKTSLRCLTHHLQTFSFSTIAL